MDQISRTALFVGIPTAAAITVLKFLYLPGHGGVGLSRGGVGNHLRWSLLQSQKLMSYV